jgi:hypothetical protein
MGKSSIQPPVGEVVLVQKKPEPAVEAPKIREISHKEYERTRPKKELSVKQQENLAKLVERNKQRALERRAVVKDAVPEAVPEDKELVIVKPKRKYVRKIKEEPKNVVVHPPSESEPESATETESEVEVKPRRRTPAPKPKKQTPKKAPQKYKYETETTSADDWSDGDDSDEDYEDQKVQKYQAKAHARLKAVQDIDKRMSQIQGNPYVSRNLSVF